MEKMKPLTSIIILAHKEPEKFKKMFETLFANTHQEETPFEIVVVDNESDRIIWTILINALNKHKINFLISPPKNVGTSKGFNIGADNANGYYVCFFNSDYYMMDNWLKSMIDCFEHKKNIGLISCCTNASGNEDEKIDVRIEGDKYVLGSENDYKESECAIAQMFTTKKIWEEVGGFGEEFFPITFEDLDFNEKIKENGYKIFVNRKCFGYHDYNTEKNKDRQIIMERNRKLFKKKWGDKYKWA